MTIPSKTVGILSVVSCLHDIHQTSLITSEEARQKACADSFISTSIGSQKTNHLSYKDAQRKNWLLRHNLFATANETFASIGGYFKGVGNGIIRYLPNFIFSILAIVPGKKHKITANVSAGIVGILEIADFICNGTNINEKTDYLK